MRGHVAFIIALEKLFILFLAVNSMHIKQIKVILSAVKKYDFFSVAINMIYIFSL